MAFNCAAAKNSSVNNFQPLVILKECLQYWSHDSCVLFSPPWHHMTGRRHVVDKNSYVCRGIQLQEVRNVAWALHILNRCFVPTGGRYVREARMAPLGQPLLRHFRTLKVSPGLVVALVAVPSIATRWWPCSQTSVADEICRWPVCSYCRQSDVMHSLPDD